MSGPTLDMTRNIRRTAFVSAGVVAVMTGAAFAAVPLYEFFCKATGYGGTPMVRSEAASRTGARTIAVRFDANVAPGLNWRFEAETPEIEARVGQTTTVNYRITNVSNRETTGMASFNVQPELAGAYFVKLQCFCFTEHTLKPGESFEAPVVFYVDPDIEKNPDLAKLRSITLSYTYFPARGGQPLARAGENAPRL